MLYTNANANVVHTQRETYTHAFGMHKNYHQQQQQYTVRVVCSIRDMWKWLIARFRSFAWLQT